jgi:hypothetical protein
VKKIFAALALCFCSSAMYGQKTRLGQELPHAKPGDDYPIKVHISGLHYRRDNVDNGGVIDSIYADAVINGKNVELMGGQKFYFTSYKLPLGDYQARLLKDSHKVDDAPLFQVYELVFPDKTVWRCTVTGISE